MSERDEGCECPDARAFRALVALMNTGVPGAVLDRMVAELAARRTSVASGDVSAARDWTSVLAPYSNRVDRYDTPAQVPEEIRASVKASWDAFEQRIGPMWEKDHPLLGNVTPRKDF